jgi:hypothetical protein
MKSFRSQIQSGLALTIIILLLVAGPVSTALADTSSPSNAGLGTNVTGVGTSAWSGPNNITLPTGSPYAIATLRKTNLFSNYLKGTQYGFNLPLGATIMGIEVVINRQSSGHAPNITDNVVSLVKGGLIVGNNNADTTTAWPEIIFGTATYGSPTDLWGTTWTSQDINSVDFGVVLAAQRQNFGNSHRDASVDYMQITVYYTLSPSTTTVTCGTGTAITYGDSITCVATVTDAGTVTPTGMVSWTTDGSGTFDFTQCTLTEEILGTATCSVVYTPTTVGTGSHLITANYSGDANDGLSSGSDTVTVNKKPASVTPDAVSKTYGNNDPTLTGTLTGFLPADNVTPVYTRTAGETVLGSPYTISATLSPAGVLSNYNITSNTANFTITKRPITVTADAKSKVVGRPDPVLTYTIASGSLAFSDTFSGALTRVAGENVGTYAILQSSLALNANYTLTYFGANLTITNQRIYSPIIIR